MREFSSGRRERISLAYGRNKKRIPARCAVPRRAALPPALTPPRDQCERSSARRDRGRISGGAPRSPPSPLRSATITAGCCSTSRRSGPGGGRERGGRRRRRRGRRRRRRRGAFWLPGGCETEPLVSISLSICLSLSPSPPAESLCRRRRRHDAIERGEGSAYAPAIAKVVQGPPGFLRRSTLSGVPRLVLPFARLVAALARKRRSA